MNYLILFLFQVFAITGYPFATVIEWGITSSQKDKFGVAPFWPMCFICGMFAWAGIGLTVLSVGVWLFIR